MSENNKTSPPPPLSPMIIGQTVNILFVVQGVWSALTTPTVFLAFLGWLVALISFLVMAIVTATAVRRR